MLALVWSGFVAGALLAITVFGVDPAGWLSELLLAAGVVTGAFVGGEKIVKARREG